MGLFEAFGSALFDRRIRQLQMERDEKNGVRPKQEGVSRQRKNYL